MIIISETLTVIISIFKFNVYGYVSLSLQKIGFETVEARLAPVSTIQVYIDKATATVQTADHMYTECTVLFSFAQAHFTNQTISLKN